MLWKDHEHKAKDLHDIACLATYWRPGTGTKLLVALLTAWPDQQWGRDSPGSWLWDYWDKNNCHKDTEPSVLKWFREDSNSLLDGAHIYRRPTTEQVTGFFWTCLWPNKWEAVDYPSPLRTSKNNCDWIVLVLLFLWGEERRRKTVSKMSGLWWFQNYSWIF